MSNLVPKHSSLVNFDYQLGLNNYSSLPITNTTSQITASQIGRKYYDFYDRYNLFSFDNKDYLINFLCIIIIILLLIIILMHIKEYYKLRQNSYKSIDYYNTDNNLLKHKNNPKLIKTLNSVKLLNAPKSQIKLLNNKTMSNKTMSNKTISNKTMSNKTMSNKTISNKILN